jgi:hypothetical protein
MGTHDETLVVVERESSEHDSGVSHFAFVLVRDSNWDYLAGMDLNWDWTVQCAAAAAGTAALVSVGRL